MSLPKELHNAIEALVASTELYSAGIWTKNAQMEQRYRALAEEDRRKLEALIAKALAGPAPPLDTSTRGCW